MKKGIIYTVLFLTLLAVVLLVEGAIFMCLWNWIMPYLFNLPKVSLLMSIGIMFLIGLIFKCFQGNKGE